MRVIWQCTKKQFKEGWLKTLVNTHNMQITDGTIPGLYLRYYAGTNRISFYLAYRSAMTRKHRNILVGKYSDFKLEEIKDRAIKIRQMLATGIDPIEEQVKQKKKKEEELATRVTVDQVFEEYMEKHSKNNGLNIQLCVNIMDNRWTFDNDELFDLVACGKKRGTCSLYSGDDQLSKIGDINIIYNSKKEQIKIRITNVRKCRFCDVDKNWARVEGEGDLSLAYWQRIHREFFKDIKSDFKETDMLELNEFILCV